MIAKKVRQRYRASMYTKLGDQMVFLIERAEADGDFLPRLQAFCRELLGELRLQYGVEARIGIGQLRSSLLEAPQSYLEAQKAVSVGAAVGLEAALYTSWDSSACSRAATAPAPRSILRTISNPSAAGMRPAARSTSRHCAA